MKTSVSLDKAIAVSHQLRDKEVGYANVRSVWLIWSNAFTYAFMDQGQANPFC